ncbi:MAG: ornithine cyclodeaminase family protein [Acidobacteriota bacterium]
MKVLVVNREEVQRSLSMRECVEVMADVLMMLGRGHALNPLRSLMWLPDKTGLIGMMPACLEDVAVMGVKAISVFPANPQTGHDTHQGAVLLFETKNGRLLAMLDAGMITALRTAAVSGAATRLLARRDAKSLALLGSGMQATTHLEAMCVVRDIRHVRVWSRNLDHARDFAERETACRSLAIEPVETAAQAVDGADIICTATSATEPVLKGDWIAPVRRCANAMSDPLYGHRLLALSPRHEQQGQREGTECYRSCPALPPAEITPSMDWSIIPMPGCTTIPTYVPDSH